MNKQSKIIIKKKQKKNQKQQEKKNTSQAAVGGFKRILNALHESITKLEKISKSTSLVDTFAQIFCPFMKHFEIFFNRPEKNVSSFPLLFLCLTCNFRGDRGN